jgi:hypothetical protein
MLGRKRAFALIGLAMLASGPSFAAEWIDTTKLPRLPDSKEIYVNPATTQFTVPVSVPLAAEGTVRLLTDAGWQQYGRPFSAQASNPNMAILQFKKGRDGLSVFINVAPAQGYATAVGYTASAFTNVLPFPKNATDIEFDHDRPHLNFITTDPVDETLEFFRQELVALNWTPWSLKEGANPPIAAAGVRHEKGAYAYYVRDAGRPFATRPLQLVLLYTNDGRSKVELKGVPPEELMVRSEQGRDTKEYVEFEIKKAAEKEKAEAEMKARAEARAEAAAKAKQERVAADAAAADIIRRAQDTARQVVAEAMEQAKTATATQNTKTSIDSSLGLLAGNPAPIPVPDSAEEVDFDGRSGKLEFESKSGVQALAAFYRAALKSQGWREKPTVINRPNMVSLDFSKQNTKLDFTIMQMGKSANVSVSGSGLVVAKAAVAEQSVKSSAQVSAQSNGGSASVKVGVGVKIDPSAKKGNSVTVRALTEKEMEDFNKASEKKSDGGVLEAEADSALPAPTRHTQLGTEKTPFRIKLTASIPAELPAVLDFYRRELVKLNWKEQAQGAVVKADEAAIAFTAPEGPAVLTLGRKDDETTVELSLRKETEAQKAGMLPKDGQAKVLFGSMVQTDAVVTINKQTIKVAAGVGAKKPDGPTIDLPPGKYKYALKVGGKPAQSDEFEVGADQTWGLMIGPGGALTLQVY